jgi:hypothetical protein
MGDVGAESSEKEEGAMIIKRTMDNEAKGGQPVSSFPFLR